MTTSNDRLDRIEAVLEKLSEELGQMRSEQTQMRSEQTQMSDDQDRGRKGEDRTWNVVKWVGGISAGLSISAAVALVGLIIRLGLTNQ